MSARYPATVRLSLSQLAKHGGETDVHSDGWGVAHFFGRDARIIRDSSPAAESDCMRFVESQDCKSERVVAHIRKATVGEIALHNTQPLQRQIGGRTYVYAHNGDLDGIFARYPKGSLGYKPVGDTDSEHAFCVLSDRIRALWHCNNNVDDDALFEVFHRFAVEMSAMGPANFLLATPDTLFAHADIRTQPNKIKGPPGLYMLQRSCHDGKPIPKSDAIEVVYEGGLQHVTLIASVPLTDEDWQPFAHSESIAVRRGVVVTRSTERPAPVPETLQRFHHFATDFIGLDRHDEVLTDDGGRARRRRVYLDTTATALMPRVVWAGLEHYLEAASANSHTLAHRAGRDTTQAIEDSRDAIGRLVGYHPGRDVVLFVSNGATGAINFLARALFPTEHRWLLKHFPDGPPEAMVDEVRRRLGPQQQSQIDRLLDRPLVVTTVMEHHSNLLPWMEAVGTHNVRAVRSDPETGALDVDALRAILDAEGRRVRVVAVQAVSNVTGIENPVHEIAAMAHAVGARIVVDGAQWVPHARVEMHAAPAPIDFLVLSGHKMYAPGSRGALIGDLVTLQGACCASDVGGGMVEYVSLGDVEVKHEVTAREEAGTPNILGSIAMGIVAETLMEIGMETVAAQEHALTAELVGALDSIDGVTVYGSTDLDAVPRAGVVSFNVDGVFHGITAAYLNDYHNIAVRNGCFCAQPYVKRLLGVTPDEETNIHEHILGGDRSGIPGMIRASLGVYSTHADIAALAAALRHLVTHREAIVARYGTDASGNYTLLDGTVLPETFNVSQYVQRWSGRIATHSPETDELL